MMSALSIANAAPSERRLTREILFLPAGLATLVTNIILTTGSALALLVFLPVALRQAQPNPLHPQHGAHHHG
jgi:hypothetical protein